MLRRFALMSLVAAAAFVALASGSARPARAEGGPELIMIEEAGCMWCARWNREIATIYPKTPEGQHAPLRRVDKRMPLPEDLKLARAPFFTPTFILVRDGVELGRIEGYPGVDFFWGLLGKMLIDTTEFSGAS